MINENDDDLPDYDLMISWIRRMPMTWAPALLYEIAFHCRLLKVFQPGGMTKTMSHAIREADKRSKEIQG